MLSSLLPRLATDSAVRVFPGVWKPLFLRLPSQDRAPSLPLLSLFVFYFFSYLLLKTMGSFSECLMSSASVQKLFCGICSAFRWSFDEFVGEKVVSPSLTLLPLFLSHILFYLLSKRMSFLSRCLMSSASFQKLFCGICSAFKFSFNEFVGKNVVSLSCSSTILLPSTGSCFYNHSCTYCPLVGVVHLY